jgi:hypothetical protein
LKAAVTLGLLALIGCSKAREEKHAPVPRAAPVDAGVAVKPAVSTQGSDISWLVGTWERQSGPKEWLLFNPPKEVGVISGKPPALSARGEFIPNGRMISVFLRGTGGAMIEQVLEASADYSELRSDGTPPITYRRGVPP